MSRRRTFPFALTLALALALLSPQAALGSRALYESASVWGRAETNAAAADGFAAADDADDADDADETGAADGDDKADEAGRPKRGNAFARALAAPFRALARLFGGGKSKTAKKSDVPAAPETAAAPEVASALEAQKQDAAVHDSQAAKGGAEGVDTQASGGARIVRPEAGGFLEEARPKIWVPLAVGVPSDPVSQGRALLQQGYIQEAIAELQMAATTVGPQLAEANNLLGIAYDRLGWHRQAAEAYGRALTVTPKDFAILANLGYSLYLADDYWGALRRLNEAARLAPAEPVVLNNLGVVHARLGHYDEAYRSFAKASNEYDAHLKLAGLLEDRRRDKEAVKHYEAALRLQPGASAVLERLVALYERTGQRDKADTARRTLGQPKNPQKTNTGGGG